MKIAIHARFKLASSNGVDRTIEGHIRHFSGAGHQVTLLTFKKPNNEALSVLKGLGVDYVVLPTFLPSLVLKLWVVRSKFDLLWLHSVFTPFNWVVFLTLGCPWITTPNGGYSPGQIAYKRPRIKALALKLIERRMLGEALFMHVLSKNERDQVNLIAPDATCVIAPNGCSPPSGAPSLQNIDLFHFLFIGRLAWMHKGLDLTLEALKQCKTTTDWRFDIVGAGTEKEIKYLTNIISGTPTADRVIFHGALYGKGKEDHLKRANVFVHTSRWEGMPFSVIEALSQGIPVLVTPGTNMADLIKKYDAGWIAQEDEIAETIKVILEASESELSIKGGNAQELVREELAWNKIGSALLEAVDQNLANAKKYP